MKYSSWPFKEAEKILQKLKKENKKIAIFETGYGPSGLPHIGTLGEILRTDMVKRAISEIDPSIEVKIYVVSDDMDGFRSIPDNIPNKESLIEHLEKPLTQVPDPFGTHESYGHHMNHRLKEFLDRFNFDYEFKSATECYKSGIFDDNLLKILKNYDKAMEVLLSAIGDERKTTYSPFLPISPISGKVLQVPLKSFDTEHGTITYEEPDSGELITISVTGGNCKLQWKPDWGMRWSAFGIDYETYGKDIDPCVPLSSEICKICDSQPPVLMRYELFLDENGKKISKSKGNGLSVDEWLQYGTKESLILYMHNKPGSAKRLYFDVIPKSMDEYISFTKSYIDGKSQTPDNPSWYINDGNVRDLQIGNISFSLLLNLVSACNPENKSVIIGFVKKYDDKIDTSDGSYLDLMIERSINYYNTFIKPHKNYKTPSKEEEIPLREIIEMLKTIEKDTPPSEIQTKIFEIGNDHGFSELKEWFKLIYQVFLGQETGPRMGSFISLYGIDNTISLMENKLSTN